MRIFSVIILIGLFSCSERQGLEGFDKEGWQSDNMGCTGYRMTVIEDLMVRKSEITGLGQEAITDLLGKPDMHELYKRNKKSFTYFLANGPECDQETDNPPKLIIRFDGLGRSKEIIYYKSNTE